MGRYLSEQSIIFKLHNSRVIELCPPFLRKEPVALKYKTSGVGEYRNARSGCPVIRQHLSIHLLLGSKQLSRYTPESDSTRKTKTTRKGIAKLTMIIRDELDPSLESLSALSVQFAKKAIQLYNMKTVCVQFVVKTSHL